MINAITIEDKIDIGIKKYKKLKKSYPEYLILSKEAYTRLKEEMTMPEYDEIPYIKGMKVHIKPITGVYIEFI